MLLLPGSLFAQSYDSDNPLRLIAVPVTPNPSTFSPNPSPDPDPVLSTQTQTQTSTANIPPEIRDALYPQQRTTTSITVTDEPDPLPQSQSIQPTTPTIQAATYLEPVSESNRTSNRMEAHSIPPIQIAPPERSHRTSEFAFDRPAPATPANTSQTFTSTPANSAPGLDVNRPTLADLLAESNTQTMNRDGAATTATVPTTTSAAEPDSLTSLNRKSSPGSPIDFQNMLQNIATSTCLVLCLGVGFIVIAKRFLQNRPSNFNANNARNKTRASSEPSTIRIINTLKLNGKANLQLIEVGDQRVLVASDLSGIKSVVALNQNFSTALEALESGEQALAATEPSSSAGVYTPAARTTAETQPKPQSTQPQQSTAEIEAEMKRQLSQILGGQAFADVFYNQTRAVA